MGTSKVEIPLDGEGPERQVEVSTFQLDQYEVSNGVNLTHHSDPIP